MKITLLPARELSSDLLEQAERWRLARAERGFHTPFLSAAFLKVVREVRADTWAALFHEDGRTVGLWTFHRAAGGRVGAPLARHFSDYQGIVAAQPLSLEPSALLAACGLELFDFDHLLPGSLGSAEARLTRNRSPVIDVADGYDTLAEKLRAQSSSWTKVQQSRRRLEREAGPLRFEADCTRPDVWEKLWTWKRGQFRATGVRDVFHEPWTRELIERLRNARDPGCSGVCSALWTGDRLIAAHFGLRGASIWHYWFPTYDPEWARHGPGLLLLDEMVRDAARRGDRHVDLGKGDQPYKRAWGTSGIEVLEGTVSRGGVVTTWRAGKNMARAALKASPFGPWLRRLKTSWQQRGIQG